MTTKRGEGAAQKLRYVIGRLCNFKPIPDQEIGILWDTVAALESASSPSALIAAVERLEREISECEDLEKDYTNRSTKELDDAWITADEVKHRIGGLKFALNLLRSPPTEEVA